MRGNVIGFDPDSNTGAVSGHDGKRYDFASADWHGSARPRHGDLVDFVPDGQRAARIYLIEPERTAAPTLVQFYFSPSGRISRSQYWLHYVVPAIVISLALGAMAGIARMTGSYGFASLFDTLHGLFTLLTLWPAIAVLVKRIHDRDKTGWLVLLPTVVILLAVAGVIVGLAADSLSAAGLLAGVFVVIFACVTIWFFIEFGCMRGTIGPNRFGPDPVPQS